MYLHKYFDVKAMIELLCLILPPAEDLYLRDILK